MQERIVAAAIRKKGLIMFGPRPLRHDFPINTAYDLGVRHPDNEQGFVTSEGRYVDRTEAEELARACGQVKGQLLGSVLTSEDLW